MTEDGIRTRRNLPAETWAVVRDAYLGGETAESIGRRLGLSVNTIRKRASRCGWTHSAHAKAMSRTEAEGGLPKVDPQEARRAAVAQAAALIAAGRGSEAAALLKAAEVLGRMVEADTEPPAPLTPEEDAAKQAAAKTAWDAINEAIEQRAAELAEQLLSDTGAAPVQHGLFALRWRAETLGAEAAAADRRRAEDGGWARRYWDEEGRLRPRAEVSAGLWEGMKGTMRDLAGLPSARPEGR